MRNDEKRYKGDWNSATRLWWLPRIDDFDCLHRSEFNFNRPDDWNRLLELAEDDGLALAIEMIKNGADIHAKDNMGRTALWHACPMTRRKSIPFLADMGLDINDRDREGNSPFDAGCMCGECLTIKSMMETGKVLDVDARDKRGDTALIKCAKICLFDRRTGCSSAAATLIEHYGADPDLKNDKGESARSLLGKRKGVSWCIDFAERHKED